MTKPSTVFPRFKTKEGRDRYLAAYDAALAEWPVAYEEIDVPTRLGSTHVVASGPPDAPALVLLPSFAGSAVVWRVNVEALSAQFRTFAVDVIGQPGKSRATGRIRNRRQLAGWLGDVFDGLGIARASIVGCSFGGFLALNQAVLTPDRVDRVVLISPVGTFAAQDWKLFYLMRARPLVVRLLARFQRARRTPERAVASVARTPPRDPKWSALIGVTMAGSPKVSVIAAPVFSTAQLRAIRAPTLLLIGDQERLYDPAAYLSIAQRRMPGLQGAIISDADHIAAMAQPQEVNARILKFLQGSPVAT